MVVCMRIFIEYFNMIEFSYNFYLFSAFLFIYLFLLQECNPESPASQCLLMQGSLGGSEEQQREMGGQDLQSMLEEMRDEREGDVDAIIPIKDCSRAIM